MPDFDLRFVLLSFRRSWATRQFLQPFIYKKQKLELFFGKHENLGVKKNESLTFVFILFAASKAHLSKFCFDSFDAEKRPCRCVISFAASGFRRPENR